MFYVRPNHPSYYAAPRHAYSAAPSYYAQPEPVPYVSPDELARARYLQALREQRAARKAYADALAERELQRMEQQYGVDDDGGEPYTRYGVPRTRRVAQPRYFQQPVEEDDDNEGYGYDNWADAIRARALQQERARALEQERAREIAAEHERQRLRAAQLAAEQERQRALAAAEEERRQAHAYQQAQAYADALAQKVCSCSFEVGYDNWADALRARALQQERARALEQERAREIAAEHERQRLRAAQLAAEQERQRALAAAEEERRQAHAYQQAQAYADALAQKQMNSKQPNRKLGRVTPDVRPAAQPQQEQSKPVRIHIRSRSTSPPRPTPAPSAPSTDAPPAAPEPKTALSAIATVESALSKLRETFALPPQLDFKAPRELSYASTNAPVRAYEYELGKLLEKLDEVESAGVAEIRKERKRVVELVEGALSDLEHKVEEEWRKAHPEEDVPVAKEVAQPAEEMVLERVEMEVDPAPAAEPASAPAPAPDAEAADERDRPLEPMEVEPSAPADAAHAEPSPSDLSLPAEPTFTAEPTVPSSVADSPSPAELEPTPPSPSSTSLEPCTSSPTVSPDTAPRPDDMDVEPAPLDGETSRPVRISISQDAPASQEARSVPVVDAQPVRIAISTSSGQEEVPVVELPQSQPAVAPRASEADAHASPAQRTDEFVML